MRSIEADTDRRDLTLGDVDRVAEVLGLDLADVVVFDDPAPDPGARRPVPVTRSTTTSGLCSWDASCICSPTRA